MMKDKTKDKTINAGRVLVVGTGGGGKTAIVTKLAARSNRKIEYKEEFGGTVETEFLRISYDDGNFFGLMLPIGGQEKWGKLRERFGSTAEGIIIILDSVTKRFWPGSLRQAVATSTVLPYINYPVTFIVTKQDLNVSFRKEAGTIATLVINALEEAKRGPVTYFSRGFRVIERKFTLGEEDTIPFTKVEQIIVNALEEHYFTGLVPGDAKKGKMLLDGLSLVNARLFSRALALALSTTDGDEEAIISLLNDMRPTLFELDSNWQNLQRKYPKAGNEPQMPKDITKEAIEKAITEKLLAGDSDIKDFENEVSNIADLTGWKLVGNEHISIFAEEGLDRAQVLIRKMLDSVSESEKADKFTLFDPLEELF